MALSKKLSSLTIKQNNATPAWTVALDTQNTEIILTPVFWNGTAFVELLNANLDHNLRGLRLKVSLKWDYSTQSSTIRTFINNVISDLTGSSSPENEGIRVYFTGSDYQVMIPDTTTYKTVYKNQIGSFVPEFNFISQQPLTSIPTYLESV